MSITIPDEVVEAAHLTDEEAKMELVLALFARDRLTTGQACRLLGMDRISFQRLIATRSIPMHYDVQEFREDVATLKKRNQL
ncbi:MAG: UPF0175 family protein [Verrucomicrobiota bacterium]